MTISTADASLPDAVASVRASLGGRIITPGDAAHDQARVVLSGAIDRRPAAIVRVGGPDDIVRVIEVARRWGVNFLGAEGEARLRAAYPGATWDRLALVKARYDPDNLFRLNHNVPPAPA